MPENREGPNPQAELKDYLKRTIEMSMEQEYDDEVARLSQAAEGYGITPLQMGQLDFALGWIDYEMKTTEEERKPEVELIHNIAEELGEDRVKKMMHDWLVDNKSGLVEEFPDFENIGIGQALIDFRQLTEHLHAIVVDHAKGFLSSHFLEVTPAQQPKKQN